MTGASPSNVPSWAIVWPAERFFWAVVDASTLPAVLRRIEREPERSRPDEPMLDELIADDLPCSIEELHVVYRVLDDGSGRVLACAVRRGDWAELPADTLSLRAASVPAAILQAGTQASVRDASLITSLAPPNMMRGRFVPSSMARAQVRQVAMVVGAMLLAGLVLAWGMHRRASALDEHSRQLSAASEDLIRQSVPDMPALWPATVAALDDEYALLAITRNKPPVVPNDAGSVLAELLRAWPRPTDDMGAGVQTQSLSIGDARLAFTVSSPSNDHARAWLAALAVPPGWSMAEPQLSASGSGPVVRVTATRIASPSPNFAGGTP